MKLPEKLDPASVTCIIDSREQTPLCLDPLRRIVGTLSTGDYALEGCDEIRIERKSLQDLVACVGVERDRFEREIERLLAFRVRILLIESDWPAIESHDALSPQWRGRVTKEQVIGSVLGWQAKGISVHMAGNHERAGKHAAAMLYHVARRRWRELRGMVGNNAEEIVTPA